MEVKKVRDLTLISLTQDKTLVVACDSSGSIGPKKNDMLKIPAFYTGKFAIRVGILEVMCTGAEIVTVTNAVCCEMNPTGKDISVGIPKLGKEINIYDDKEIVDYVDIKILLENPKVYEIVPVGSKGILYEGEVLAKNNNLKLKLEENIPIDIKKSNGPATTVIAAIHKEEYKNIREKINNINIIGKLEKQI